MRTLGTALVLALALGAASQARAGQFSLGANADLTAHNPEFGHESTLFGWPGTAYLIQPGLRFGFQPKGGTHEVYANTGVFSLSQSGDSFRDLVATLNYQYNFSPSARTRPYATAGFGLFNEHSSSASNSSATSGIGGGGLGVRHWVAEGHGSLRLEARYDRLGFSKNGEIGRAGLFTVRMGFDLWVK